MKTLFITSFHPFISRNILSTEIIPLLVKNGTRIVLIVPDYKKEFFTKYFGSNGRILIEGVRVNQASRSFLGLLFKRVFQMILRTGSVAIHFKREILPQKNYIYKLFFATVHFCGRWKLAVKIVRFLDLKFSPGGFFTASFERHRPNLVFSTDIQNENDIAIMQEARRRKIPIVSMVRSWDNLTYLSLLRLIPETIFVASEIMKHEATTYHLVPEQNVTVVGVPHRDRYRTDPKMDRVEFFEKIGADLGRPLIFFTPIGDLNIPNNFTDRYTLEILASLEMNVIARFPPADVVSNLDGFVKPAHMYFDRPGTQLKERDYGRSELTRQDDNFLANSLYHSNVVVTGPSTIAIDASIFDKPVIMTNFQKIKGKDSLGQVLNYEYDNLGYLLKSGGVRVAKDEHQLRKFISMYLANPESGAAGRKRIVNDLSGPEDALASKRVADILLHLLKIL